MKLEFDGNEFIKFVESLYHNQKNYYLGCCVGDGSRIGGGAVWIILNVELKKKNGTATLSPHRQFIFASLLNDDFVELEVIVNDIYLVTVTELINKYYP